MKNLKKAIEQAESNRKDLSDWLEKAAEIRQVEPYVQQAYDVISWECESFKKIAENAPDLNSEVVNSLQFSGEVSSKYLPRITIESDWSRIVAVPATAISGSSMTFEYLNEIYPQVAHEDQAKILPQIVSYKFLQENQKRYESLTEVLREMNSSIEEEFQAAFIELKHYKNCTSKVFSPATAIRNALQHFKGELFFRARRSAKDTPNWQIMAERLVLEKPPSPEYNILLQEEQKHSVLYDKLSKILKGNVAISPDELENLFIEVSDHMHSVLSLLTLE